MLGYVVSRVLWLGPLLVLVSLITFALVKVTPGGPWDRDKPVTPQALENLNRRYHLDRPAWQQYLLYVTSAVQGDLGPSYVYQDRNVAQVLLGSLGPTETLAAAALALVVVVAVPLGALAAGRPHTPLDHLALGLATLGGTIPSFALGLVLIVIFAVMLHLVPTSGWGRPGQVILPAITLATAPAAYLTRLVRASLLEVRHQDFVRTARAKGLTEWLVLRQHVLRNALLPVVTAAGPVIAFLVTGSFVVESVFGVPGIGRMYVQGIGQRDYPLVMGVTLLYTVVLALLNLLVDVLYAVLDPRISYR